MEPRRNVELKAHDPDPAATLAAALALGADDRGELVQRDTFFAVAHGRLKLREQESGAAQLIQYSRPDTAGAKTSEYRLIEIPDPQALRTALAEALGVTVVVEKRRRLLLIDNVRVHLDEVRDLGSFIELEAVVPPGGSLDDERERLGALRRGLHVCDDQLVSVAYGDLLVS